LFLDGTARTLYVRPLAWENGGKQSTREGDLEMSDFVTAIAVRLHNAVQNLREREEGQGLVEYLTLVALIALGLFVAIIAFRDELGDIFSKISSKISDQLP
jgi:Flp pilus assembly pilin Flp